MRIRGIRGTTPHAPRIRTAAALSALIMGASLAVAVPGQASAAARVDTPYAGATVYVNPDWSAKAAAEPGGGVIADEPSFVWMDRIAAIDGTPGARGLRAHLDTAVSQGADLFQVVVYNLPGRDCAALASNGELGPTELDRYKTTTSTPSPTCSATPPTRACASSRSSNPTRCPTSSPTPEARPARRPSAPR